MDKNEEAWDRVFSDLHLKVEAALKNGTCVIDSKALKKIGAREPRLMTKFDHYSCLPERFKKNHYSIMPISRSEYLLGHGEMYHALEDIDLSRPQFKSYPDNIESLDASDITSEQNALAVAHITHMIDDFLGEETQLTLQGRMASSIFDFRMQHALGEGYDHLKVSNSQIEIDASYEGKDSITVFEAKLGLCTDFLIRQLYYPFRMLKNRIWDKKIRLVFFTYSDKVFYFREYGYPQDEFDNYNSLILLKGKAYTLEERRPLTLDSLHRLLQTTRSLPEPNVPFPQANDFNRVIDILHLAKRGITKEEITANYDFEPRQADYYANAGVYLGLLQKDKKSGLFRLTDDAKKILELPYRQRRIEFIRKILLHEVFKKILSLYLKNNLKEPSLNKMLEIMRTANLFRIGKEKTYERRLSSVRKWIYWILDSIKEN